MDELLNTFVTHMDTNFSSQLASEIKQYLDGQKSGDYQEIEFHLKSIITNYFQNCGNLTKVSHKLYDAYIDNDNRELISAVKYIVRIYTKFWTLNIKKMFYKWRINALYYHNINTSVNEIPVAHVEHKQVVNNVFEKLYLDSFKKNDERLLNDELRNLSDLGECTFKPNITKKH